MKDFRSAARQRIDACFLHLEQRVFDRQLGDARKVTDFHHSESFQMDAAETLFQPPNELQEIIERQIRVQAADNMKLRGAFANTLVCALVNLLQRECVSARRTRVAPKRAQFAMCHAYI